MIEFFSKILIIISKVYLFIKSRYYTKRYIEGKGRIVFKTKGLKLKIIKGSNSHFKLNSNLELSGHIGGEGIISIVIGNNSVLQIDGAFCLGENVRIMLMENSKLEIGGRKKESGSGITCNTDIMVEKSIKIGVDLICAWNVYITDSDWHSIKKTDHQKDVVIGDHVWLSHNVSVLKGSFIGNNCIVGARSIVTNQSYSSNTLIIGAPGKSIRENVEWNRDLNHEW